MNRMIPIQIAICILVGRTNLPAAAFQANLQGKVMVSWDQANPSDAFGQLARGLKCELILDKSVSRGVTMFGRNTTYQTTLDAICEDIGCRWRMDASKIIIEPVTEREEWPGLMSRSIPLKGGLDSRLDSSMRFVNAPLPRVLQDVFGSAKVGYILFGKLMSQNLLVTADVGNQRIADALSNILVNAGIRYFRIMQTLDDPPTYFIDIRSPH